MANGAGLEARNVAGAITSMGVGELVSKLAVGIAEGQLELDSVCMQIAQFMGDAQVAFGKKTGSDEPDLISLVELGFTPNFYQFVDTILEVRVAVSSQYEETREEDTSETRLHEDEVKVQSEYEERQRSSSSSAGYNRYGYGWWGWGGSGASSSRSSSFASSRQAGKSSAKSSNLQLTTVDAKYASTYNYAVEASSLVKTKIVPVPPPTVFEEVVREKVQQRREEQERLRLTEEVRSILPSLSSSAQTLLADDEVLPKTEVAASTYRRGEAVELSDALEKLQEDHRGLSTEHWAIIRSVRDREVADEALADASTRLREILANYDEELPEAQPADTTAMFESLQALAAALGRFRDKVEEIGVRMAPPEEEATESDGQTPAPTSDDSTNQGGA